MNKYLTISFLALTLSSCEHHGVKIVALEEEIRKVEDEFRQMAEREGLQNAFTYYAAPNGVIMRNDQLIKGKDSINSFMQGSGEGVILDWKPDFIDVAKSGDLAYTYGPYHVISKDNGDTLAIGIFHTVWKRQPKGEWRFVWD